MIPRILVKEEMPSWQQALAEAITDPKELFARLKLESKTLPAALRANADFKLKVTHSYLARMEIGDEQDPLLKQVLPVVEETDPQPADYRFDPVGDSEATQAPGLIHKYHGRVLLIAAAACAIHCRYCFRRHFPYADSQVSRQNWTDAVRYIAEQDSITEVILSGGDPLVLSDEKLRSLITQLEDIPHVSRVRIHSRLPVVLPERLTPELLALLSTSRLQAILVIHANHPNEINAEVADKLQQASSAGVTLLNQSVLLHTVNDATTTLVDLSERLFAAGVLPYYLHLLDHVQGAAHFEVPLDRAKEIYQALSHALPGFLLPRLVLEEAGKKSKTLLGNQ